MARATTKPKKEISMEEALWKSADKLRGSVEPAEYKHVVLSLFFLKFASDKFEAQRQRIIKEGRYPVTVISAGTSTGLSQATREQVAATAG